MLLTHFLFHLVENQITKPTQQTGRDLEQGRGRTEQNTETEANPRYKIAPRAVQLSTAEPIRESGDFQVIPRAVQPTRARYSSRPRAVDTDSSIFAQSSLFRAVRPRFSSELDIFRGVGKVT